MTTQTVKSMTHRCMTTSIKTNPFYSNTTKKRLGVLAMQRFQARWTLFSSTFHLSLMVLVRYRTRENIELETKYTAQLTLPSQGTRLANSRSYAGNYSSRDEGFHLMLRSLQETSTWRPAGLAIWAQPSSFAITNSFLIGFNSTYLYA